MNKTYEARIDWLPSEEGGRKALPEGDAYAPLISLSPRICENDNCWGIFVRNVLELNPLITQAHISYLSPHAPDNLTAGVTFYLFEGKRLVATGLILSEILGQ